MIHGLATNVPVYFFAGIHESSGRASKRNVGLLREILSQRPHRDRCGNFVHSGRGLLLAFGTGVVAGLRSIYLRLSLGWCIWVGSIFLDLTWPSWPPASGNSLSACTSISIVELPSTYRQVPGVSPSSTTETYAGDALTPLVQRGGTSVVSLCIRQSRACW